jgi:hypothetical protein
MACVGELQVRAVPVTARQWIAGILIAVMACLLGLTSGSAAQPVSKAQAELAKALSRARVSLQDGLAVSQRAGTPISARFEVEEGTFQLSVYVVKGGKSLEVIVDHRSGKIATVAPLTEPEELIPAKAQREAMNKARKTLRGVTDEAVAANAGYRAVSVVPALRGGHPVATVTLAKGDQFKVVTARLE